ncbi:MAG TPA: hypothetical protein VJ810_13835 [Blastocatellia bacterium]|nr:hypothetical protein [Blastocatellia bacterium]
MNALRMIKSLGPIDATSVRRDPLLRWIVALPPLIALLVRFFLPVIIGRLENTLHFGFGDFYQAIAGYALLITAPVQCCRKLTFLSPSGAISCRLDNSSQLIDSWSNIHLISIKLLLRIIGDCQP